MKPLFILSIITLLTLTSVVAQTPSLPDTQKNAVKVGIGSTFFGFGDITGIRHYTEYSRQLLPYLQVAAGYSLAQASSTMHRWQQAAAKTLDLNFSLIPLRTYRQNIKIGAGVSGRHLTDIYSIGSRTYERGPEYLLVEEFEKQEFNSVGYTALLEYEYLFAQKWVIGTRASFQNYRRGSTVLSLGINGGIRF